MVFHVALVFAADQAYVFASQTLNEADNVIGLSASGVA
jgi:hypothetical protein